LTSTFKHRLLTRKTVFCSLLASTILGYIFAIPYFVEVVDVQYSVEQRIPEYFKLTIAIEVRSNALLDVTVGGVLILHCIFMNGSKGDINYPLNSRTVKPHSSETLEAIILFTFTTPEKSEAIYAYSVDAVISIAGALSSRTIEVKSIYSIGEVQQCKC
jgi:hypothetical protein